MKLTMALLCVLILSGCSVAGKAFVAETHAKAKTAADSAAQVTLIAPCAMTHGAYTRLNDADQRAVDALECKSR